jgi:hypothetical protein
MNNTERIGITYYIIQWLQVFEPFLAKYFNVSNNKMIKNENKNHVKKT